MNQNRRYHTSGEYGIDRFLRVVRKGAALLAVAALTVGMTGCSLDDILMPIGGEIPFEQEQTTPPEAGAVDNVPTVPGDLSFDDLDNRPL